VYIPRTFQESLLPTRLLVVDDLASWHCSCCRWWENRESQLPTYRIYWKRISRTCFSYGLPTTSLWVGLLWRSRPGMRRRKVNVTGLKGANTNGRPSWSWVGWEGMLDLNFWDCFDWNGIRQLDCSTIEHPFAKPISVITEACRATVSIRYMSELRVCGIHLLSRQPRG
jgi:hypothetical protein